MPWLPPQQCPIRQFGKNTRSPATAALLSSRCVFVLLCVVLCVVVCGCLSEEEQSTALCLVCDCPVCASPPMRFSCSNFCFGGSVAPVALFATLNRRREAAPTLLRSRLQQMYDKEQASFHPAPTVSTSGLSLTVPFSLLLWSLAQLLNALLPTPQLRTLTKKTKNNPHKHTHTHTHTHTLGDA